MPNILITGDKGFVGKHLSEAIGNFTGYDLKDGYDIRDKYKLDVLFESKAFDVVIHCAALTSVRRGESFPEEYIKTNIMGTKNLVDMAEKYKIGHFIHISSSSVYADKFYKELKEDDELEPDSIYGMTKLMAEKIVQRSSIPWTIIRPFTVYGEDGREDQVIGKWLTYIKKGKPIPFYGDGSTGRTYTYVKDLVKGICDIMKSKKRGIFNLAGNEYITLENLWIACGCPEREMLPLPKGDRPKIIADTSKAKDLLEWKPKGRFLDKISEIWRT